jgi:heme-degrading monooxygenase HmoA
MPFHVVVRMQAQAERLAEVLALVQREFSRSPTQGIGRRRGRLFQRLDAPTDLIGIIEWENQQRYDAYRSSATHRAILDGLAGASHARYCQRLFSFERVMQRAEVAACALIEGPASEHARMQAFVTEEGRAELLASPGLIGHEVYRAHKGPSGYIVVHQWRTLADLERFRSEKSVRHEAVLAELGATIERFTGHLTAEYPPAPTGR